MMIRDMVFYLEEETKIERFPCDAFGERESFSARDIWCTTALDFVLILKANLLIIANRKTDCSHALRNSQS